MQRRYAKNLLRVVLISMFALSGSAKTIDSLGGVESFYTPKMAELLTETLKTNTSVSGALPILLTCIRHPSDRYYIGVKQTMLVRAAFGRVRAILDNIGDYSHLFPGYKDIRVIGQDGDKILTYWEQSAPLPLIPSIKYEIIYRMSDLKKNARVYQYQLRKPSKITASDGFILIRSLGLNKTSYVEYDFFNANWGPAKILGEKKIWHDSVEGLALSDLATKLRAENWSWSDERARRESHKLIGKGQIDRCIEHKISLIK